MSDPSENNKTIFIFDSTRLRSHLFFRWLSTHSNVYPIYHPYLMAAMFGPDHLAQHLKHSEIRQIELDEKISKLCSSENTFSNAATHLESEITKARAQHKTPLMNEHWFNILKLDLVLDLIRGKITTPKQLGNNPTCLPDTIFDSIKRPIILIRHPALSINSIYRTALQVGTQRPGDEDFDHITMVAPLRLLFDYFRSHGRNPIVVDGEDILWRTNEVGRKLCQELGLGGEEGLSERWKPTSRGEVERMNPLVYALTKTIHDSSGIERPVDKPEEPDLVKQYELWRESYGDEVAGQLRELAEDALPQYEYLSSFKI